MVGYGLSRILDVFTVEGERGRENYLLLIDIGVYM